MEEKEKRLRESRMMKKVEEHLQGQAHAPSRQNICSVLKMWYFWKHAIAGHCFYTTSLVIEPYRTIEVPWSHKIHECCQNQLCPSYFFARYLHACCI